ncbi:hypothetical protein B0H12DRAFT_1104344 [Mycena haematopus]|nr:hypothetical protein B0H12DRAFT_1104344 [Mycena haematopus]
MLRRQASPSPTFLRRRSTPLPDDSKSTNTEFAHRRGIPCMARRGGKQQVQVRNEMKLACQEDSASACILISMYKAGDWGVKPHKKKKKKKKSAERMYNKLQHEPARTGLCNRQTIPWDFDHPWCLLGRSQPWVTRTWRTRIPRETREYTYCRFA